MRLFIFLLLAMPFAASGQSGQRTPFEQERRKLEGAVTRSMSAFMQKPDIPAGEAAVFSLRFKFSEEGYLTGVTASVLTPKAIAEEITKLEYYRSRINWEILFSRKIQEGDVLIVPMSIYQGETRQPVMRISAMDRLLTFPDDPKPVFSGVTLLQPIVIGYWEPVS